MAKKKRLKVKYKNILILGIIVIIIGLFISSFIPKKEQVIYMKNIVGQDYNNIDNLIGEYKLDVKTTYEYNDEYQKDIIVSQSVVSDTIINKGDVLEIVVSKGKLDLNKLKEDGINELGKVPIMMYHGIKDIPSSETKYVGGNVDGDGYTRTAEAFREDLEFYYREGYRMVKLTDYVNGNIDIPYGTSPIVLTFDDGNANNIKVTGKDTNGNLIIDPNSAVGILEEFKKKYSDYSVTAIFFLTNNLFNQPEYDEEIIKWLVDNGYEVGNHTQGHNNFSQIDNKKTEQVVGYMYQKLDRIIPGEYAKIVALPYGSPYKKDHKNYPYILKGEYEGFEYETIAALRVGWEPEVSPYNKNFDASFLKRCRAYDNNGKEFDIEMVFKGLKKTRYISDGDMDIITTRKDNESVINNIDNKKIVLY